MSFLTLLLSRFFHEENYYDHKKTNITLSNTRIYLGGKHPLVVFNCCCSFKSMEAFIQQKFSRVLDKENIACLGTHISWSYIQTADRFTKVKTEINLFHLYSRRGHSLLKTFYREQLSRASDCDGNLVFRQI